MRTQNRILSVSAAVLLVAGLSACGNSHRDPVFAGADAAQDARAAESHVRNHMSINACPPGFVMADPDITTGSSAFMGIRNGEAETSSAANGTRQQRCVQK